MPHIALKQAIKQPIFWFAILLALITRLLPHPPGMTALTSVSLFLGAYCTRSVAVSLSLIILILSDIGLAYGYGYPSFGDWSWFTYSGLIGLAFIGRQGLVPGDRIGYNTLVVMAASSSFWLWTNLGVWLLSGLYSHTGLGLASCYLAALPFLGQSLVSDSFWWLCLSALIAMPYGITQRKRHV